MKNLIIKAEFLACTDIEDAAADLIELAKKLDVMTSADFNGILITATRRTRKSQIVDWYYNQRVTAFGRPQPVTQILDSD